MERRELWDDSPANATAFAGDEQAQETPLADSQSQGSAQARAPEPGIFG